MAVRSSRVRPRWTRGGIAALVVLLPRALSAQTPTASAPATPSADASPPADAAARDQAQGAAALQATQELEARLIEVRRELDAMERERASVTDLRRRLDELEARQAAARADGPADWTSVPGGEGGEGLEVSEGGVVLRSPGNRFMLHPGLRLQGLYEADLATSGGGDVARPDSSAFKLAHAELLFEGHAASPRFEYRIELDFADTQPRIVKDAFVQWRFARAFAIRVGQLKVPFGLETQYWNANLELVDVAQATTAFSLDRDVGLMIVGRPLGGRLQFHLAATNGPRAPCPSEPGGPRCDDVDLAYAARLVAAPLGPLPAVEGDLEDHRRPLVSIGVSGAYLLLPTDVRLRTAVPNALLDVDQNGRIDNVSVVQGAVELRALFRGVSLQAEWMGRREHPGVGAADRAYSGVYGQASTFVLARRLQAVVRVGRSDLPLYGLSVAERTLRGSRVSDQTVGLNAYLRGHDAKLQVDYTHASTTDAESAPNLHRLRAALQLSF